MVVDVAGIGRIPCAEGISVLRAMAAAGRSLLPVGCRSGGCGVCRVRVACGRYRTGLMSRAEVSAEDVEAGIVLACQLYPLTDLELVPLGRRPRPDACPSPSPAKA